MNTHPHLSRLAAVAFVIAIAASARACPFCDAPSQTLREEMQSGDAAVLAKLLKEAPPISSDAVGGAPADPNAGMATFEVIEVLRGQDALGDARQIQVVFFGEADRDRVYLINGLGGEKIDWTTPLPLSPAGVEYVRQLLAVPTSGIDRLAYYQEYLEHEDPLLAQDAYDEFARAPYADVVALKERMHHDRLVKWIADPAVSPSRRRLYLTMLGVCGSKDDLPLLESMIVSDFDAMEPFLDQFVRNGLALGGPIVLPTWMEMIQQDERRKKLGLDALVACYLILRGPDGLDLIDERFLKNPHVEYTYIYSTIMALRFHGDENTGVLPRERLLKSMRLLLDNPDFADQVVLDLSRWDDWSVLDRLVEMFKKSDEKGYVRQPVVSYLTVASEQQGDVGARAKAALEELERLDPETVKQARSLMAFGALGRARGAAVTPSPGDAEGETTSADAGAFSASDADNQTDSADIPDPAAFNETDQSVEAPAEAKADDTAAAASSKAVSAAKVPIVRPSAEPAAPAEVNPLLVAGLPLAAAALLMGVYWLILRAGAV